MPENIRKLSTARKLAVATASSCTAKHWTNSEMTFEEFCRECSQPRQLSCTADDYAAMSKDEKSAVKDKAGAYVFGHCEGGRRTAESVTYRDAVCLDADKVAGFVENPERIEVLFQRAWPECDWYIYSTVSHTTATPRYRVVFPLSRSVSPDEYEPVARSLAERVSMEIFDPASYRHNQLMYWPAQLAGGAYVAMRSPERDHLDVDSVLAEFSDWQDSAQWPMAAGETPVKTCSGAEKRKDPREASGVRGAFCRAYTMSEAIERFLGDVYLPSGGYGDRYTYSEGTTANGAIVYDDLWMYSHHANDPAHGRLLSAFELVCVHLFGDPSDVDVYNDMRQFAEKDPAVIAEIADTAVADFTVVDAIASAGGDDGRPWRALLSYTNAGGIAKTLANIVTIISHDDVIKDKIRYNELKGRVVAVESIEWPDSALLRVDDCVNGRPWTDADDLSLRVHLERRYGISVGSELCCDAVNQAAHQQQFHPVREYLQSLDWDGVARVDTMLVDVVGCEDTEYTRAVSRKLLVAAVARSMQPGIKYDHMVVLEGAQGKMKSRFCEALAVSSEWYADGIESFHGKESIESLQGAWIVEVPELAVFGKSQIEQVKAFITRRVDRGRMAYARRVTESPRQCVLIGSTNDKDYLKDDTGNRRFWPIRCGEGQIRIELLKGMVDQLYAEAMTLWNKGEALYIENESVELLAKQEQADRRSVDEWSGVVEEWLKTPGCSGRYDAGYVAGFDGEVEAEPRDRVCALEVWVDCLGGDPNRFGQREARRINGVLENIVGHWNKNTVRFGDRFGRQRGYIK